MTQFIDHNLLVNFVASHPTATAQELLLALAGKERTLVCAIGIDDVQEINAEDPDSAELTSAQQEQVLYQLNRNFDWTACHDDIRSAIEEVQAR
jgi:hypothetical protein